VKLKIALILIALTPLATAQAQMCKWVAEDGSVHYAKECPEGEDSQKVDLSTTGPSSSDDPYAASTATATATTRKSKGKKTAATSSGARPDYSKMSGSQLRSECERQRQARLKPEREQLIADCKAKGDKDAAQCQRFYADHGNGGRQGGRTVPRKYDNLMACAAARDAGA